MMKYGIYSVHDGSKLVKLLLILFILVTIIYFLFGRKSSHDMKLESHDINAGSHDTKLESHEMMDRSHDLSSRNPKYNVPQDVINKFSNIEITTNTVSVQECEVFYREVSESSDNIWVQGTVVLLHGQAFTSEVWVETNTLQLLGALGYKSIAIDIPGYGKSTGRIEEPTQFLHNLFTKLSITPSIIISPSMSGTLSLPYLITNHDINGFVAVAPIDTEKYVESFVDIKVRTWIVYGENDKRIGPISTKNLEHLPNHITVEIEDAGHAAYIDNPVAWHNVLYDAYTHLTEEAMEDEDGAK